MRVTARGAAALLSVPLLLLATGCAGSGGGSGSGSGGGGGGGRTENRPEGKSSGVPATPAASASPGAPGSTAVPTARTPLERAALVQGDLAGYQISAQAKNPNAPDGQPQADKKTCQPLADIMGDKPDPAAGETVNRGVGSQKQLGLAVSVSLSAYSEVEAKHLVSRLREAIAACGDGFSATVEKQTGTYKDVRGVAYKVGGDESVSWTTTAAAAGVSAPVHVVVVREGSTVVRLMALNVAATSGGQPVQVPHELADRQLEKLGAAVR
ncbi:hypothetical protein [Streptomyces sp. NRRL S-87]|uniref:hypothetical protein n=1 Tax=Streptomyces sp. NRRL S-87 TaxID=1463920 RepID=UPI0004C04420|nr:hypothetical protein [Streptomyces sp. NRRL S-87]